MSGHTLITTFESTVLQGNPLNDPYRRKLAIYLPPGYDQDPQRKYPVVFLLSGFASRGFMFLNSEAFSESIEERLNRLIQTEQIQPMVVVMPDCFTYYGGSQYLDSEASGRYETHLTQELVPYIKNHFQVKTDRSAWALVGKSSGGYGSLILAMRHPELFGIAACHSGDMGFEYCYQPDFPEAMLELEKCGSVPAFMEKFYALKKKDSRSFLTLNILAMAAAYSPNLATKPQGFDLPFHAQTGELKADIWEKWLAWDPVRLVETHQNTLKQLKLFIDCGTRDEFRLYAGARLFSARLNALSIPHTYEEFDDNHMKTSYRYDRSLKFISNYF